MIKLFKTFFFFYSILGTLQAQDQFSLEDKNKEFSLDQDIWEDPEFKALDFEPVKKIQRIKEEKYTKTKRPAWADEDQIDIKKLRDKGTQTVFIKKGSRLYNLTDDTAYKTKKNLYLNVYRGHNSDGYYYIVSKKQNKVLYKVDKDDVTNIEMVNRLKPRPTTYKEYFPEVKEKKNNELDISFQGNFTYSSFDAGFTKGIFASTGSLQNYGAEFITYLNWKIPLDTGFVLAVREMIFSPQVTNEFISRNNGPKINTLNIGPALRLHLFRVSGIDTKLTFSSDLAIMSQYKNSAIPNTSRNSYFFKIIGMSRGLEFRKSLNHKSYWSLGLRHRKIWIENTEKSNNNGIPRGYRSPSGYEITFGLEFDIL